MKLLDFLQLTEAPIKDIKTFGMDKPLDTPPVARDLPTYDTGDEFKPTMPKPDAKMLSNPRYWNVAKKRFAKSQYTYNLYFANFNMQSMTRSDPGDNSKQGFSSAFTNLLSDHSGIINSEMLKNNWALDIPSVSGVISGLFISNADVSRVSMRMTPWIMAHRLGHAMDDEIQRDEDDDPYHTLSGYFVTHRRNQIRMLLDPENKDDFDFYHRNNFAGYGAEEPDLERSLFYSIPYEELLTMKTARTGNLLVGETFPELLAQFILQNKITLARPLQPTDEDDYIKFSNGYEMEDKYISYSAFAEYEFISEAIDKVESEANAILKTQFDEWASNGVIFLSP